MLLELVLNTPLFYFFIDLLDTSLTKLPSDFIETRRSLVHIEVRAKTPFPVDVTE